MRGKLKDKQSALLLQLAKGGIQSEPEISKNINLKIDYTRKIIRTLRTKEQIQIYSNPYPPIKKRGQHKEAEKDELEPRPGRPPTFYGLSEKGIISLIDKKILAPEDFWRMAFQYFKPNNSFKISIKYILKYYEENFLDYERIETFTQLLRSAHLDIKSMKEIIDKHCKDIGYPILFQLGISLLKESEITVACNLNEKNRMLKLLSDDHLIIYDEKYYRLTFFGLMLLLNRHYEIMQEILKDVNTVDESFEMLIKPHMITYPDFLPLIFGKWKLLRKYWSAEELFEILIWAINDEDSTSHQSIATDSGLQELFDDHKNLLSFNEEKMEKEYTLANRVLGEFFDKKRTELLYKNNKNFQYSKDSEFNDEFEEFAYTQFEHENKSVIYEIDLLRLWLGFQDKKWSYKKSYERMKVELYEEVFPKIVTFRFYTLLFQRTIFSYGDKDFGKWLQLFKKDTQLVEWYSNWLKKFLKYNEIALEKRKEFLNKISK